MKTLGQTPEGDSIVQLTRDEHRALSRLAAACGGELERLWLNKNYAVPDDTAEIASWLDAVVRYVTDVQMVDRLHTRVEAVANMLRGVESEED